MSLNKDNNDIIDVEIIADNSTTSTHNENSQSVSDFEPPPAGANSNDHKRFFYQSIFSNFKRNKPLKIQSIIALIIMSPIIFLLLFVAGIFFIIAFIFLIPRICLLLIKGRQIGKRR